MIVVTLHSVPLRLSLCLRVIRMMMMDDGEQAGHRFH